MIRSTNNSEKFRLKNDGGKISAADISMSPQKKLSMQEVVIPPRKKVSIALDVDVDRQEEWYQQREKELTKNRSKSANKIIPSTESHQELQTHRF